MRKDILTNLDEPTDNELSELMLEVVNEAKQKALIAKKKLTETITKEIKIAKEKFKAKQL